MLGVFVSQGYLLEGNVALRVTMTGQKQVFVRLTSPTHTQTKPSVLLRVSDVSDVRSELRTLL